MSTVISVICFEVPNCASFSDSGVYTRRYCVSNLFQDGIKNVLSPGSTGPRLPGNPMGVSDAGREGP